MTTLLAAPAMRQGRRSVARRQAIGPENVKPQTPFIPPSPIAATQSGETLHRVQPGVGLTGVHPAMVKAVAGLYAAMVAAFWLVFGHGDPPPLRPFWNHQCLMTFSRRHAASSWRAASAP